MSTQKRLRLQNQLRAAESFQLYQNSTSINSHKRLKDFKQEWIGLVDSQFQEKSSTFNDHYQSVVKTTINQSSDLFNDSTNYQPFKISRWITQKKREVEQGKGSGEEAPAADNKFIAETLNISISDKAAPLYMPPIAQPHTDDFRLTNTEYSLKRKATFDKANTKKLQDSIQAAYSTYKDVGRDYSKMMGNSHDKRLSTASSIYRRSTTASQHRSVQGSRPRTKGKDDCIVSMGYRVSSQTSQKQTLANQIEANSSQRPQSSAYHPRPKNIDNNYGLSFHSRKSSNHTFTSQDERKSAVKVKTKPTSIGIIDEYYQSINNHEEVERIKYINEYQRLMDQVVRLWKAHPQQIPAYEQRYTKSLLDTEVYKHHSSSADLLVTLNSYLRFLTSFLRLDTSLRNLLSDRDSTLFKLKLLTQANDLSTFESQGTTLLLQLRHYTLHLIRLTQKHSHYLQDSNQCYLHQGQCLLHSLKDTRELRTCSLVLRKLGAFIKDYLVFRARDDQDIMQDMQGFTVTEISQYERICEQLHCDQATLDIYYDYLKTHQCPQEALDMKYNQDLQDSRVKEVPKPEGIKRYFKFEWNLGSQLEKQLKQNEIPRVTLLRRLTGAYEQLKQKQYQEKDYKNGDSETEMFQSITELQNQASYREDIHLFHPNQEPHQDTITSTRIKHEKKYSIEDLTSPLESQQTRQYHFKPKEHDQMSSIDEQTERPEHHYDINDDQQTQQRQELTEQLSSHPSKHIKQSSHEPSQGSRMSTQAKFYQDEHIVQRGPMRTQMNFHTGNQHSTHMYEIIKIYQPIQKPKVVARPKSQEYKYQKNRRIIQSQDARGHESLIEVNNQGVYMDSQQPEEIMAGYVDLSHSLAQKSSDTKSIVIRSSEKEYIHTEMEDSKHQL